MLRLCACLAVPVDVIEPCGFPLSAPALRRVALDYGSVAEVVRHASWDAFRAALPSRGGRLLLFTTAAADSYLDFEFHPADTLLFGRESAGAPDEVHAEAAARLLIPISPLTRALNVVTAAALALGEALRQTRTFPSR